MRIFATVVLPPLLIFAVLLAIMLLPLPPPFPRPGSDMRERAALLVAPFLFIAYLAAVTMSIAAALDQPGRALDRALAGYNLTGRRSGFLGRSYRGDFEGYPVSIDFQPAAGIRSHVMNVSLSVPAGHRASAGNVRPILDCQTCPEVPFSDPTLASLHIYSDDEVWLAAALAGTAARSALAELIDSDAWSSAGQVYVQPERIWLRAHPRLADGDSAGWMRAMVTLAAAVGAPQAAHQP